MLLSNIKKSFFKLHQLDPTYEYFINALKCTVPGLLGAFCWIYLRKPFSSYIILLPVFTLMIVIPLPGYIQKIKHMFVFVLLLGVIQFISAVLFQHYFMQIAALFIIFLFVLSSIKYRTAAIMAVLCITVYVVFPGGWYNGLNRLIEAFMSFFIALFTYFVFEYFTAIFHMRSILVYLIEVNIDAFLAFTTPDKILVKKSIQNKYLFERPLSFKADFAVEKIYKSDLERFVHRVLIEHINKGKFIDSERFFFRKNKAYLEFAYSVLILCRRMFRNATFILRFNECRETILKLFPDMDILIKDLVNAYREVSLKLKKNVEKSDTLKLDRLDKWLLEYEKISNSGSIIDIDKESLEVIYGFKCAILDLKKLEKIINDGNKV